MPGDNSVDLFTNDLGLVVVLKDGELEGFNIVAGGGMGACVSGEGVEEQR